jgi:hypothetical protein
VVHGLRLQEFESLEAISQDEETCALCLRMAELSAHDRLAPFLRELALDQDLDSATKETLTELACDARFLHAVEDYVHATKELH